MTYNGWKTEHVVLSMSLVEAVLVKALLENRARALQGNDSVAARKAIFTYDRLSNSIGDQIKEAGDRAQDFLDSLDRHP